MGRLINTGVKLDETLHARLKALGLMKDRSPHWLMRAAIEAYVEREEAYEKEKREDQERWARYQLSGRFIPHDEVEAWLQSLADGHESPCPK